MRLWPSSVDNGVEEMLMKRFPKLKIIKGREDILAALTDFAFYEGELRKLEREFEAHEAETMPG